MRVATLNVWGLPPPLAWPPRHVRFPRVRRFLEEGAFDVVGLQELWRPAPAGFKTSSTWGSLVVPQAHEGNSGLAFATRMTVSTVVHEPYTAGARFVEALWTKKGFLQVKLDDVDVFTTHLQAYDTHKDALVRAKQVDALLLAVSKSTRPVVVMGDFNVHEKNAEDQATLKRIENESLVDCVEPFDTSPTWAMFGMAHRYDRIFGRGVVATEARVIDARVSDHRPVQATLTLSRDASRSADRG